MDRTRSILAYLSSLGSLLIGKITLEEIAMYIGIVTAIGTFVVNWYYKYQENHRQEKRHAD